MVVVGVDVVVCPITIFWLTNATAIIATNTAINSSFFIAFTSFQI